MMRLLGYLPTEYRCDGKCSLRRIFNGGIIVVGSDSDKENGSNRAGSLTISTEIRGELSPPLAGGESGPGGPQFPRNRVTSKGQSYFNQAG